MTVPAIGLYSGIVPNPNTQSAEDFSTNAVDWTNYQANTLGVDINASIEQFNIDFVTVNDNTVSAAASAAESAVSAAESAASALTSQSLANFKGRWSDATGAATVPSAYSNNGQSWQLLQDIPDITADEPVDGAPNWQVINDINLANVQYDLINNPVSHFFGENKIVEKMAVGTTLKSTRPSGATFSDRYDTVTTVLDDTPREQLNGLLAEITSTNLALWSDDPSNIAWSSTGIAITPNFGTAPDGSNDAARLVYSGADQLLGQSTTLGTGVTCSASYWVKGVQGETISLAAGGSDMLHTLTGGWDKLKTENRVSVSSSILLNTFSGATARDVQVWRGQLEAVPFPTSGIKTTTTPETRASDNLTADTFGNVPDLTNDWSFHFEVDLMSLEVISPVRRLFNVTDDRFFLQLFDTGLISVGNTNTTNVTFSVSQTVNIITVVQEATVTKVYVNGVLAVTGAVVWELLNTDNFYIGQSSANTAQASCAFKNVRWYAGALNIDSVKTLAVQ